MVSKNGNNARTMQKASIALTGFFVLPAVQLRSRAKRILIVVVFDALTDFAFAGFLVDACLANLDFTFPICAIRVVLAIEFTQVAV